MKFPLVAVVSFYAAGLLLAGIFQPPLAVLFVISFLILSLALLSKLFRPFLIWPLLVLAGWTNLIFHTAVISPDDLRTSAGNIDVIVSVRGVLDETPNLKISERSGEPTEHSLAQARVSELQRGENWQPASGEIIITTPGDLPEHFFAGQAVEISGVIARPPLPLADGLFDYRDYLQTRGIYYQLKTDSANDWQLREPILSQPPLTDRFLDWSKRTLALGLPAEDEPLKLLWAMTLGWRTAFTGDISEPFLRAGTMHLFAIDGLRIALISGMLVALLRVLQISRAWCGFIAIPAIWFYTAATGWESSAVRASVMMTIILGGWSLKRPANLINSLAAAAFIILLWEPRQLFEAGFQLSFFVVLVIGLLTPPLNDISDRLLKHDPLVPDELLPRWRRWGILLLHPLARYASLSFAAWVGSIPLSAKYFHLFSPVSTPANIIAVPLGTLALMSNLGALVCGAWFPWATEMFNHSAWFFMSAMTDVSEWSTKIPGAYFYVAAPSWISILLYYFVLIVILSGWLKTTRRRFFCAFILVCIAAVYLWQWNNSRDETQLTVLPLNGGHAVFVDAAGRSNDWLVNCGDANAVEFTLASFLRAQGVNKVPRLILTEGDGRNISGAAMLDQLFKVGELWTSNVKFRSPAYRDAVGEFENSGRPQGSRHNILSFGEMAGCWQVLWPDDANHFPHADDNALVLLGNFQGTKILLLSDLGRDGQSALLEHTNDLRADIVVAGLPNDGEPLCDALIAAVQPKIIIVADSEFPATRRAGRELKDRLEQAKTPAIYTRVSGAVKIATDKSGWRLETMDGQVFNSAASSGQMKHIAPAE
jgi:competence protein ComEC